MTSINENKKIYVGDDGRKYVKSTTKPKLYWSQSDIDILKRYFPTTNTQEVADMIGVGLMTVRRKARELGIVKNQQYRQGMRMKYMKMALLTTRVCGNNGSIRKGEHRGKVTEFKPRYTLIRVDTGFVGTSREIAEQIGADQTNVVAAAKRNGKCNGIKIEFYDTERI